MNDVQEANVIEVFSSIQGEGRYVGYRQVFVRFSGCNLKCKYCDTLVSHAPYKHCTVERAAGARRFVQLDNPVDAETLARHVEALLAQPHHSVSFTGGEPLYRHAFMQVLAGRVRAPFYLETNGTLYRELAQVVDLLSYISMDIKLPSIAGRALWDEHAKFLQIASKKEVFVKIVVSGETTEAEFLQAVRLIADCDARIPLVVQPVTPTNGCLAVAPQAVLAYQMTALRMLRDVRVIPQTHKYIGQM